MAPPASFWKLQTSAYQVSAFLSNCVSGALGDFVGFEIKKGVMIFHNALFLLS
jgi:hypothetical protein